MSYEDGLPPELFTRPAHKRTRRLKVDLAQTSFFDGREFRTFKEISIAGNATYLVKAVVPIDIILHSLSVSVDTGHLRVETNVGGTPTGTFSETLPAFAGNTMTGVANRETPYYTPTVVLTAVPTGGTLTGGLALDVIRIKTASNTQQAATVGFGPTDERGVVANTYYFKFTALTNDAVEGVWRARWEERPTPLP